MPKTDPTITVKELLRFCEKQIEYGNGDKKVLISTDDEGNGYHNLYYAFTDDYDEIKDIMDFCQMPDLTDDLENYVILG